MYIYENGDKTEM